MGSISEEKEEKKVNPPTRQEELHAKYSQKYGDELSVVTLMQRNGKHKVCALRQFNRMEYALFEEASQKLSNLEAFELFLNTCWLEGDDEIKTNSRLFLQLYRKSADLMDYGEVVIKKN